MDIVTQPTNAITKPTQEEIIDKIISFVHEIGINIRMGDFPAEKEFVPGICIQQGGLVVNPVTLKYPGDILHEAGHLAVVAANERATMDGVLERERPNAGSEEMMAIAWSYAAALHIGIDPNIVFHEHGYGNGGGYIVENFSRGQYIGLPMLQWKGLCYDDKQAKANNAPAFPHMLRWLV